MADFERSEINTFQNRNIEVQGCFYHLFANIWKHTQHLGLSQRYNQEEEFALHIIRMLPALAFLPAGDVIEGFEELADTIRVLYNDVQMTFYSISRTPTSVDIVGMHQGVLRSLLLTSGTCSTELTIA